MPKKKAEFRWRAEDWHPCSNFAADLCLLSERERGGDGVESLGEKIKSGGFFCDSSIFGESVECKDWPYHATAKS